MTRPAKPIERLVQPDTVVPGGIDGLYWYRGDLLGIQNTSNPGHVVRIHLARDGGSVTDAATLQPTVLLAVPLQ